MVECDAIVEIVSKCDKFNLKKQNYIEVTNTRIPSQHLAANKFSYDTRMKLLLSLVEFIINFLILR